MPGHVLNSSSSLLGHVTPEQATRSVADTQSYVVTTPSMLTRHPTQIAPQGFLDEIGQCARDITLNWWERLPGGPKVKEYFDYTSLHGLKYFSEPGRSLYERFYWFIALVLVYISVIGALYDQTMLFLNKPVLMSMDSTTTPIWDIPFPAVTICSENQVRPSYFNYSYYRTHTNLTKREQEVLDYLTLTCMYNSTKTELEFFTPDILGHIHKSIWQHCTQTVVSFTWMSKDVDNPCQIFQPVLTPVGACHTFNSLPGDRLFRESIYPSLHEHVHQLKSSDYDVIWSPDRGYRGKQEFNSPPWRTSGGGGYGQDANFELYLNSTDFDEDCYFGGHGFLVSLHSPAELPSMSHPSTYVHADRYSQIKVVPNIKTTDEELRIWKPKLRGCFFEDERPLKYFQFYTERNCDLECESNASLSHCGCVPFFHPRTRDTPVCGPEKFNCYIQSIARSVEPETTAYCNCLPSCFEIEYRISVVNFQRNFSIASGKGFYKYRFPETIPENNFAVFSTQFQTQKVTALKRIAVFSFTDFIANIGGLLGLFMGFSFLSLFEIVYFCVLRFHKKRPKKTLMTAQKH